MAILNTVNDDASNASKKGENRSSNGVRASNQKFLELLWEVIEDSCRWNYIYDLTSGGDVKVTASSAFTNSSVEITLNKDYTQLLCSVGNEDDELPTRNESGELPASNGLSASNGSGELPAQGGVNNEDNQSSASDVNKDNSVRATQAPVNLIHHESYQNFDSQKLNQPLPSAVGTISGATNVHREVPRCNIKQEPDGSERRNCFSPINCRPNIQQGPGDSRKTNCSTINIKQERNNSIGTNWYSPENVSDAAETFNGDHSLYNSLHKKNLQKADCKNAKRKVPKKNAKGSKATPDADLMCKEQSKGQKMRFGDLVDDQRLIIKQEMKTTDAKTKKKKRSLSPRVNDKNNGKKRKKNQSAMPLVNLENVNASGNLPMAPDMMKFVQSNFEHLVFKTKKRKRRSKKKKQAGKLQKPDKCDAKENDVDCTHTRTSIDGSNGMLNKTVKIERAPSPINIPPKIILAYSDLSNLKLPECSVVLKRLKFTTVKNTNLLVAVISPTKRFIVNNGGTGKEIVACSQGKANGDIDDDGFFTTLRLRQGDRLKANVKVERAECGNQKNGERETRSRKVKDKKSNATSPGSDNRTSPINATRRTLSKSSNDKDRLVDRRDSSPVEKWRMKNATSAVDAKRSNEKEVETQHMDWVSDQNNISKIIGTLSGSPSSRGSDQQSFSPKKVQVVHPKPRDSNVFTKLNSWWQQANKSGDASDKAKADPGSGGGDRSLHDAFELWLQTSSRSKTNDFANGKAHTPIVVNGKAHAPITASGKVRTPLVVNGKAHTPIIANGKVHIPIIANGKAYTPIVAQERWCSSAAPPTLSAGHLLASLKNAPACISNVNWSLAHNFREIPWNCKLRPMKVGASDCYREKREIVSQVKMQAQKWSGNGYRTKLKVREAMFLAEFGFRIGSGGMCKCYLCNKCFKKKTLLQQHIGTHTVPEKQKNKQIKKKELERLLHGCNACGELVLQSQFFLHKALHEQTLDDEKRQTLVTRSIPNMFRDPRLLVEPKPRAQVVEFDPEYYMVPDFYDYNTQQFKQEELACRIMRILGDLEFARKFTISDDTLDNLDSTFSQLLPTLKS